MSEEENMSVAEETQQAVAQAPETETVQEERPESAQDKKRRNDAEYNWAEARRKMQDLDLKNREMQDQIAKLTRVEPPVDDEIDKMASDDIVTKAQAEKLAHKMATKIANDIIKQREAATVDERLQAKFSDFNEIVTKENIELLKQNEPELAFSLSHNPDPFAQGIAAYKLLKKLEIGSPPVNTADKERATKNAQKPLSANAVTRSSALGNAHLFENGLTTDLKKQLWDEMKQAMKGA